MQQRRGLKTFSIPEGLYQKLFEEASSCPGVEICGLIGGRGEIGTSLYPVANVSPVPATAFYMDPRGQIDAMNVMRRCGEDLVGIYHSHPTTDARPSSADRQQAAYPGVAYLIISVANAGGPEIAAFVFDGEDFAEIGLEVSHN